MGLVLLIPAYRPGEALPALVEAVRGEFDGVVFVTADVDGQPLAEDVLRAGRRG